MGLTFVIGGLLSLIVIVPLIALLLMDKASGRYRMFWWVAVSLFAVTCFALFAYVMSWPFYSQTVRQTPNPGGPSGHVVLGILFWVLLYAVAIPSFPALVLLSLFPPKSHKRRYILTIVIMLYAIILALLTLVKFQMYMTDYRAERAKPKQTPFERFEHLRR
jgi:Na+/melibiose symporter-like transporter